MRYIAGVTCNPPWSWALQGAVVDEEALTQHQQMAVTMGQGCGVLYHRMEKTEVVESVVHERVRHGFRHMALM